MRRERPRCLLHPALAGRLNSVPKLLTIEGKSPRLSARRALSGSPPAAEAPARVPVAKNGSHIFRWVDTGPVSRSSSTHACHQVTRSTGYFTARVSSGLLGLGADGVHAVVSGRHGTGDTLRGIPAGARGGKGGGQIRHRQAAHTCRTLPPPRRTVGGFPSARAAARAHADDHSADRRSPRVTPGQRVPRRPRRR